MSPGRALLGSGREQVNELRVVATQGPCGSGYWGLSQASPPKDFKRRMFGAG